MKKKDEIREELNELSPLLARMKKENSFKVPRNYFESLPDKVMEQVCPQPQTQQAPQIGWLDRLLENLAVLLQPRYAVGLATIAILIVAGVFYLQKPGVDQPGGFDSPLAQYISDNIDEFDAEMIYELTASGLNGNDTFDETTDPSDEYLDEYIDELDDSDLEELL